MTHAKFYKKCDAFHTKCFVQEYYRDIDLLEKSWKKKGGVGEFRTENTH